MTVWKRSILTAYWPRNFISTSEEAIGTKLKMGRALFTETLEFSKAVDFSVAEDLE
jgi:hypothetical protein